MESRNTIHIAFHLLCLLATLVMLIYVTSKFIADESITTVNAKAFHNTEKDIYPSFSLCLEIDNPRVSWLKLLEAFRWLPLYDKNIMQREYGIDNENKIRDYVRYLMGNDTMSSDFLGIDKMNRVDYDKSTVDLRAFMKQINVYSGKTRVYHWSLDSGNQMPFYVSYRHPLLKCFSIDISWEVISNMKKGASISALYMEVDNNNTVFSTNSRFTLAYFLHYPQQLMRSTSISREQLAIQSKLYRKIISIDNMEIIRRRNTQTTKCLSEESDKDDDLILQRLVEKTGCRPPHWHGYEKYPKCTRFDQMFQLLTPNLDLHDQEFLIEFEENPGSPCNQIFSISYTVLELKELKRAGEKPTKDGKDEVSALGSPRTDLKEEKPDINPAHIVSKRSPPDPSILYDIPETRVMEITFRNSKYKEIKDVQAFCIESYIGNLGGYLGLFIGVSIWQAPDFLGFVVQSIMWIVRSLSALPGNNTKLTFLDKHAGKN